MTGPPTKRAWTANHGRSESSTSGSVSSAHRSTSTVQVCLLGAWTAQGWSIRGHGPAVNEFNDLTEDKEFMNIHIIHWLESDRIEDGMTGIRRLRCPHRGQPLLRIKAGWSEVPPPPAEA
jgi:hypothetical protein